MKDDDDTVKFPGYKESNPSTVADVGPDTLDWCDECEKWHYTNSLTLCKLYEARDVMMGRKRAGKPLPKPVIRKRGITESIKPYPQLTGMVWSGSAT